LSAGGDSSYPSVGAQRGVESAPLASHANIQARRPNAAQLGGLSASGYVKTSAAFVHKATAANTLTNNQRNAILIVTHIYNPVGVPSAYNNHPIGVYYTGSQWTIYNEDLVAIVGTAYNVPVIQP